MPHYFLLQSHWISWVFTTLHPAPSATRDNFITTSDKFVTSVPEFQSDPALSPEATRRDEFHEFHESHESLLSFLNVPHTAPPL